MTIKLSGYSDDLISVEGDIHEEFQFPDAPEVFMVLSDGTALRVRYDGVWRFTPIHEGRDTEVHILQAVEDDEDNYSDIVTVETNMRAPEIAWVALSTQLVHR